MKTIAFVKKIPFSFNNKVIFCNERNKEISLCKSEKAKQEKFYVWLVLEEVIEKYLHLDPSAIVFSKQISGKWTCDDFFFSLSHTDGYVAVAISSKPVGVDIQKNADVQKIRDIILNDDEASNTHSNLDLLELFSKKEAIFKSKNEKYFVPKKINVKDFKGECLTMSDYVLSVFSENEVEVINL